VQRLFFHPLDGIRFKIPSVEKRLPLFSLKRVLLEYCNMLQLIILLLCFFCCMSLPCNSIAPTVRIESNVEVLNISFVDVAAQSGSTPAVAFIVTLGPQVPLPASSSFGQCGAPRTISRTVSFDVSYTVFYVPFGVPYLVSVASSFSCGVAAAVTTLPTPISVVPVTLPTLDQPQLWFDAESFPLMSGSQTPTGPLSDSTGKWSFLTYNIPSTTGIRLIPRAPGRSARAFQFQGVATDFLYLNGTTGSIATANFASSAADTKAFGFAGDSNNDMTVFAAFQSTGGGFVVSKGGYPYFSDAGWNIADYSSYMGLHAEMTTGAICKRCDPTVSPRVDMAINYTSESYQPAVPGALTTFSLYRDRPAVTNNSMVLDACLGVTYGTAADECNNPGPGIVPTYNPWYPHIVEDQDLNPNPNQYNNVTWPAGTQLMSQRVFPFIIGSGLYWSNAYGTGNAAAYNYNGYVYSIVIYRRKLSQAESTAVQQFLSNRYNLACPATSTCPQSVSGSTCLAQCPSNQVAIAGTSNLVCGPGAWFGSAPVCSSMNTCAAASAHPPGYRSCRKIFFAESFRSSQVSGANFNWAWPAVWESVPILSPKLFNTYWTRSASGLVGSVPIKDDNCSFTEPTVLAVNRPAFFPTSLSSLSLGLVTETTVQLRPSTSAGVVVGVTFSSVSTNFPNSTWGSPNAYPAVIQQNTHSFIRVTATADIGAIIEVVLNGAVVASYPWNTFTPPSTNLVNFKVMMQAQGVNPTYTYSSPVVGSGFAFFLTFSSTYATQPATLQVNGWPVAVGSVGVHVVAGRAIFSDFVVTGPGDCGVSSCSNLLRGQGCDYTCPNTDSSTFSVVASCGTPGGALSWPGLTEQCNIASPSSSSSSSDTTGAIIGGVIGGVAGLIIILVIAIYVARAVTSRKRLTKRKSQPTTIELGAVAVSNPAVKTVDEEEKS
jgi:hypothetical protein